MTVTQKYGDRVDRLLNIQDQLPEDDAMLVAYFGNRDDLAGFTDDERTQIDELCDTYYRELEAR